MHSLLLRKMEQHFRVTNSGDSARAYIYIYTLNILKSFRTQSFWICTASALKYSDPSHSMARRQMVGSLTSQRQCTSYLSVVACRKWWRTVIHWYLGHCSPLKPPHGHCAEREKKSTWITACESRTSTCTKCSVTYCSASMSLLKPILVNTTFYHNPHYNN